MARVFVTGSADGLGKMAAELLIEQGHKVVLHARSAARAEETPQEGRRRLVMAASEKPVTDIFGSPDDMKFRSCMTLFDAVSKQEIFAEAIAAFYPDGKDRATLEILETSRRLS